MRACWRLAFADNGDLFQGDWHQGLVVAVALYSGDGSDNEKAGGIALAEDCVVMVERVGFCNSDEELAAICIGSGVGHGQASRPVEGQVRIELVLEAETRAAFAGARRVASLDHVSRNDAVEGGAVVERAVVILRSGRGVGPVFSALSEGDEMGDGPGRLLIEKLAGDAANGGVDDRGGLLGDCRYECGGGKGRG